MGEIILFLLVVLVCIFVSLIVIGANRVNDRKLDDIDQMKMLRKYKEKKRKL